jgi:hypothetical protein
MSANRALEEGRRKKGRKKERKKGRRRAVTYISIVDIGEQLRKT